MASIDDPLTIERLPGKSPGTVILRLTGLLTATTAPRLRAHFRDSGAASLLIFDLSGLLFIDAAGIGELLNSTVDCRKNQVRLVLAAVRSNILNIFRITCMTSSFTLAATVEEAEANF